MCFKSYFLLFIKYKLSPPVRPWHDLKNVDTIREQVTKEKHFLMLLQSWSEVENIFLFVFNPTRGKDSQNNSKAESASCLAPQRSQHGSSSQGSLRPEGRPLLRDSGNEGSTGRFWLPPQNSRGPDLPLPCSFHQAKLPRVLSSSHLLLKTLISGAILNQLFRQQPSHPFHFPCKLTVAWHPSEDLHNKGTTENPWDSIYFDLPNSSFIWLKMIVLKHYQHSSRVHEARSARGARALMEGWVSILVLLVWFCASSQKVFFSLRTVSSKTPSTTMVLRVLGALAVFTQPLARSHPEARWVNCAFSSQDHTRKALENYTFKDENHSGDSLLKASIICIKWIPFTRHNFYAYNF